MSARGALALLLPAALLGPACAGPEPDPMRYRLRDSGTHWDAVGGDRVLDDLRPRYPEFFAHLLDPARSDEANLRALRDDLEGRPVTRRNYDALNALAIAYFEINYRSEAQRGRGIGFVTQSYRAAKLAAVPWRAYGEVQAPGLRDAILDFFEDAARSEKLGARRTATRLTRIVASLRAKEDDPGRLQRIDALVAYLQAREREARQDAP